jgi:hypothetical protein
VVNTIRSLVDPTFPLEIDLNTTHVFFVISVCSGQGDISFVSKEPPPSTKVISFDWNSLAKPRLPSSIPFQIIVQVDDKYIYHIIIDERAYVSILSSTAWKDLGSPDLVLTTNHLLDFNRRPTEPLGILPQLPITLGEKTVYIDVMVVQGPLDFNCSFDRTMSML